MKYFKYLGGVFIAFTCSIIGILISNTFVSGFFSAMVYCFLWELYDIYLKEREIHKQLSKKCKS